ncbi:anti-sigma factor family protein [Mucilaginibacter aquaedulcis]|uniref:anti-sigma factor family protein n=1 Tax=Mucilaginibacter aquaedulcis TaxID=1187081 RepID=UPI0025B49000|nr:hypothetical protein [Mucilaginibacter aquaedulcis]MDN3548810.1 hypothetical protein [Mucilaginibacter aquaedulcis]
MKFITDQQLWDYIEGALPTSEREEIRFCIEQDEALFQRVEAILNIHKLLQEQMSSYPNPPDTVKENLLMQFDLHHRSKSKWILPGKLDIVIFAIFSYVVIVIVALLVFLKKILGTNEVSPYGNVGFLALIAIFVVLLYSFIRSFLDYNKKATLNYN